MLADLRTGVGTLLSRPGAFLLCLIPTLLLGAALALWLQPEPHSDWGYYWEAAGRYRDYERGGLGLWLLAIPKALGLPPALAALSLNLPAAMLVLWLSWRADDAGKRGLWLAAAAYLLLVAPFFGLVQLDLVASALLGAGAWLAVLRSDGNGRARLLVAILLAAAGVSTRPQFALTLWTMLLLVGLPWMIWRSGRKKEGRIGGLLCVLLAGSLLGFGIDYGLRHLGDRSGSIRTSSAVTLYAGLLASTDKAGTCGRWSLDATRAARKDRKKPLAQAVADRLSAHPPAYWVSVLRCKFPAIVLPEPYALDWLANAPNVRDAMDRSPRNDELQTRYFRALRVERALYHSVVMAILGIAAATSLALAYRRRLAAVIPVAWVASFWLVHLVFEIQGRYFLGMYLLMPLLCMLVLSLADRQPGSTPGQARVSAQTAG